MVIAQARPRRSSEARVIEIDTDRVLQRVQRHFAVIDIGSNSIRLMVYDDISRAPFPRFNEKSMVALGAGLARTGRLSDEAIAHAVHGIRRFASIARAMDVEQLHVIATEATRRASNGGDLVEAVHAATGLRPRVLTGQEEATYAATGVISGFFQPKGLAGDFGGGSLEVAEVLVDRVGERRVSMPLGALPVKAMMEDGIDTAKAQVDAILKETLPPLLTEPVFYPIGGGWRALARVHIAMTGHPISVVHGYEIAADEARSFAKKISRMTPDAVAALPDAPARRLATLPAAGLVLSRVLKALKSERVVFSAFGLREGWLYSQISQEEQYRDPLLEGAQAIGLPHARVAAFSAALGRWTDDLFPGETQAERRLRLSVCALTDIAWRDHEKVRATEAFLRLLQFPFVGLSHPERAFLATAVTARYGGPIDDRIRAVTRSLLSPNQLRRAEILGRVLLLGHRVSASVPEILAQVRVRLDADAVRLEVRDLEQVPDGDAVQARLRQLARAVGVDGAEIVSG